MAPFRAAALVAALLALGAAQAQLPPPDLSTGATSQADGNAGTEGAAATSPSATPASPATVTPPVAFSSPPLLNLPVGTPLPNPVFPIPPQLPFLGNATTPHVTEPAIVGPVPTTTPAPSTATPPATAIPPPNATPPTTTSPTTTAAPESAQGKGLINIRNGTIPFYPGINFTQPALTQPTAPQPQPPAVGATPLTAPAPSSGAAVVPGANATCPGAGAEQSNVPSVASAPGVLEPTIITAPPLVVQLPGGQPTGRENATGNFTTAYNGIPPGGNATAPQRNTTLLNVRAVNATAALYVSAPCFDRGFYHFSCYTFSNTSNVTVDDVIAAKSECIARWATGPGGRGCNVSADLAGSDAYKCSVYYVYHFSSLDCRRSYQAQELNNSNCTLLKQLANATQRSQPMLLPAPAEHATGIEANGSVRVTDYRCVGTLVR